MAINFKRPQAMKSLNNDLGSIPGGRKSKLSSTLWLKNPKPTEADWQGKQQTFTLLLLLLLLLAAMTYNQVQSFQINDYANHYEDIEITGYRAIYSKSIADRGTAGPVDCFNKSLSDCYIRVYRSF